MGSGSILLGLIDSGLLYRLSFLKKIPPFPFPQKKYQNCTPTICHYACNISSLLPPPVTLLYPRSHRNLPHQVRNGHIKRITDGEIQSLVLEILGTNVSTSYITCPADPKKTLGIKLPFLVMIIKNVKKYFTFEVQVGSVRKAKKKSFEIFFCLIDKISFYWFPGPGRQECATEVPGEQLSVHDPSQAVYLYNADETGRGMESDPVQSVWLYKTSVWDELRGDVTGSDSCKLSH